MTSEEIAAKLAENEQRGKSNTHRLDALEKNTEAVNNLATAVKVMATKQDGLVDKVDALSGKVDAMEAVPAKRWDSLVDKLLFAGSGAVIAWIAAGAPGL